MIIAHSRSNIDLCNLGQFSKNFEASTTKHGTSFKNQYWENDQQNNGASLLEAKQCLLIYDYVNRNEEKTPMCRISELAKFHKLKHEYILLDESGPAHKKCFSVKLILSPGHEFEGVGPSIKKAQQDAAQNALENTILPSPPSDCSNLRQRRRSKDLNPLTVLKNITGKLGITFDVVEEVIESQTLNPLSRLSNYTNLKFQQWTPALYTCCNQNIPPWTSTSYAIQPSLHIINSLNGTAKLLEFEPHLTNAFSPYSPYSVSNSCMSFLQSNWSTQQIQFPNSSNFLTIVPPLFNNNPLHKVPSDVKNVFDSSESYNLFKKLVSVPQFDSNLHERLIPTKNKQYKVTLRLSIDDSKHIAIEKNLKQAKLKAASFALSHLYATHMQEKYSNSDNIIDEEESFIKNAHDESVIFHDSPVFTEENRYKDDGTKVDKICIESNVNNSFSQERVVNNETGTINEISANVKGQQIHRHKRQKQKSAVSQLHEFALRLRMNIEFEVIVDPTSKPHNRRYTLRCRVFKPFDIDVPSLGTSCRKPISIVADGEGSNKKIAKQNACQKVIEQLKGILVSDPFYMATALPHKSDNNYIREKTVNREKYLKKANIKRKTIIKDIKMDPSYGQNINPVSRLIQVIQVQSNKQKIEPTFRVIDEQGQNRSKSFTVEVSCLGERERGTGPNKKLAKRAAAEAMLAKIGYVKPLPQPGKSVLKKSKSSDVLENSLNGTNHAVEENLIVPAKTDMKDMSSSRIFRRASFGGSESWIDRKDETNGTASDPDDTREPSDSLQSDHNNKRRVRFNNQVRTCPASDDETSTPSIAPLKSEIVLNGKMKKRSRHSNVVLLDIERFQLASAIRFFLSQNNTRDDLNSMVSSLGLKDDVDDDELNYGTDKSDSKSCGPVFDESSPVTCPIEDNSSHLQMHNKYSQVSLSSPINSPTLPFPEEAISISASASSKYKTQILTAKKFLEKLGHHFKFTVVYSDFPKAQTAVAQEQHFSLVTLGLYEPIICHGGGATELEARNDAAYNAITKALTLLDGERLTAE